MKHRRKSGGRLNLLLKLLGAVLAVWGALFANGFQERLTGTSLLSQREQAESELRAKMFGDLIGPLAGQPGARPLDADRELLLAELLALNFHEHFEFKPLLEHVDDRLRTARDRETRGKAPAEARRELRSIARRVAGRQIASLLAEAKERESIWDRLSVLPWPVGERKENRGTTVHLLKFQKDLTDIDQLDRAAGTLIGAFGADSIVVRSPDGADSLRVVAHDADWSNQTVRLEVQVWEKGQGTDPTSGADFELTWFDFPMTDNTLLKDGNRFAFVLKDVHGLSDEDGVIHVQVVWFPRGYFTPRERPFNQRELQDLVGKKLT